MSIRTYSTVRDYADELRYILAREAAGFDIPAIIDDLRDSGLLAWNGRTFVLGSDDPDTDADILSDVWRVIEWHAVGDTSEDAR